MDLGQIPGFYYDNEKKKYFKIQANHVAPIGAAYNVSTVKKRERETKKRKVEDRKQQKRLKQTVRRPGAIQDPIVSGIGITRETGLQASIALSNRRDAAFLSQIVPHRYNMGEGTLLDSIPCADDRIALATGRGPFRSTLSTSSSPSMYAQTGPQVIQHDQLELESGGRRGHDTSARQLAAFNSTIIGLHYLADSYAPPDTGVSPIVAVAQEPKLPGNVFIGAIFDGDVRPHSANLLTLGSQESSLWSSSVLPNSINLAISGTEGLFVVNTITATVSLRFDNGIESRALTWLDRQTIAYAQHSRETDGVALWDLRSEGKALRFRRTRPTTGVKSPGRHGVHLLVADNRRLDLYDTRMGNSAMLSFPHIHQGPQLQFDVSDDKGLVAALDANNQIQTYSLPSGKAMGALKELRGADALYRKLRWLDDDNGVPMLQACQGSGLVRWSWAHGYDD